MRVLAFRNCLIEIILRREALKDENCREAGSNLRKKYFFEITRERVKKANGIIYKALRENQRKQNGGLQYAALFRAK
jgi:hypothetical protein